MNLHKISSDSLHPPVVYAGVPRVGSAGGFFDSPMKSQEQYKAEIASLKLMIEKLKNNLKHALEAIARK